MGALAVNGLPDTTYDMMGFELALSYHIAVTRTDLRSELVRLVRQHDSPDSGVLAITIIASLRSGLSFPSSAVMASSWCRVSLSRHRRRDTDRPTRRPLRRIRQARKLAEDALIEALTERRPPTGPDAIGLDRLVVVLIDQHITHLAEDGRSVRTLDTYRCDAGKLAKFIAGVRVGEASPARIDAALDRCQPHMAPHWLGARTLLRGALQLAVLNNVLGTNPVRDVQSIRSKTAPKGASALTAEQLRDLLNNLRASEACQRRNLVDPITLFIASSRRACGAAELLALRWDDFDAHAGTIGDWEADTPARRGCRGSTTPRPSLAAASCPWPSLAIAVLNDRRVRPYVANRK